MEKREGAEVVADDAPRAPKRGRGLEEEKSATGEADGRANKKPRQEKNNSGERTVEALDELLRPIMQDVAMLKANWGLFAELGAKAECRRNAAEWEEWGTRNEIESVHTRMRTFFGIKRDMPKFGKYYKLGTRHLEASCAHCEPAHRETPCRTCLGGIYGRRCVELAASKVMQTVNLMKFREEAAKEAKDYLHRIRGEYRHESIHKLDKVIKEIEEKLMLA